MYSWTNKECENCKGENVIQISKVIEIAKRISYPVDTIGGKHQFCNLNALVAEINKEISGDENRTIILEKRDN